MILPFSTQINGKPSNFVSKIWESIIPMYSEYSKGVPIFKYPKEYQECLNNNLLSWYKQKPKRHTVRGDLKERWRPGINIHFFINVRQKNMFRFAPVLPVVSTQEIEFIWKDNTENLTCLGTSFDKTCTIIIDDRFYGDAYFFNGSVVSSYYTIPIFANNDGFDTPEELFAYFNKNFKGKIIHWTDLKY